MKVDLPTPLATVHRVQAAESLPPPVTSLAPRIVGEVERHHSVSSVQKRRITMTSLTDEEDGDLHCDIAGEESELAWCEATNEVEILPIKGYVTEAAPYSTAVSVGTDEHQELKLSSSSLKDMLSATERIIIRSTSCSNIVDEMDKKVT
jgi:hypothetical protein